MDIESTKYFYCQLRPFKQPPTTPIITFLRIGCFCTKTIEKGITIE